MSNKHHDPKYKFEGKVDNTYTVFSRNKHDEQRYIRYITILLLYLTI